MSGDASGPDITEIHPTEHQVKPSIKTPTSVSSATPPPPPLDPAQAEQDQQDLIEVREKLTGEVRNEGEASTADDLLQEKLKPTVEEDDGGFERMIFTHGDKTFSFRGREELPIYPTLSSSRSKILGEGPEWVKPEDWEAYRRQVNATQSQAAAAEHLVVNRTPLGVVEVAIALGSTDEDLVGLRDEIRTGVYSERTLEIIDQLVAADFIDDSGEVLDTPSLEGEGLVMLSLLGDEKAKKIVDRRIEEMRRHDEERAEQNKRKEPEAEPYKIEDLVVVHATRYLPQQDEQGRYIIRTTQDAQGQRFIRNSVHFSLNGKVEANDGGNWSDSNYVIIEPMADMIKDNGLPQELVPVDTFWARNPGEPLILSTATLIVPDSNIQELFEASGNVVKIKTNVDVGELKIIAEDADGEFIYDIENRFVHAFPGENGYPLDPENLLAEWNAEEVAEKVKVFLNGGEGKHYMQSQLDRGKVLIDFLLRDAGGERGTLQDRMIGLLEESGATTAIKPGVDRFAATDKMAKVLAETVKAAMRTRIQEMAVKATIERLGFEVKEGGDYAWDQGSSNQEKGIEARKRMEALAASLGITSAPHSVSPSGEISQSILRSIGAAKTDYGTDEIDWKKYELNAFVFGENVPKLDPKTRRALYASGLLNARA